MKSKILILALAVSFFAACKGSQSDTAAGTDSAKKVDTVNIPGESDPLGRSKAANDTSDSDIGPGKDKAHVNDTESKEKH